MIITKQQVKDALAEQRVNRPRRLADANIRSLLRQFGGDASTIGELKSEFYPAVYAAAGGVLSPEEIYGTITDVSVIDATKPAKTTITALDVKHGTRIRSPLVAELESRLAAARAKTRRSVPGGRVDIGAPAQFGDEHTAREYPSDGRKMS